MCIGAIDLSLVSLRTDTVKMCVNFYVACIFLLTKFL